MHLLITDEKGNEYIIKKSDIRRVCKTMNRTIISFIGLKNTSISIKESPSEFYDLYLKQRSNK